ncbi:MAG: uroporphyrinogen-III C-methyltransferase [Lachnospiraceae bacterium]|nr:uroporphyrinogen-III C-methyltransferase [Lachnospiraceae bacterium]
MQGKVILAGAGCGRGLITYEALKAIRKAEVIIYDDLIDNELLQEADRGCELIYVGKRLGQHSKKQEEINSLLLQEAKKGRRVLRLKGGDSFVFGRGGEEILYLKEHGIECETIAGVSSAYAVPERFGIPVTHRGIARSFTVVTGHTADETEEDYKALAALKGTLVFLMGLHNAKTIASKLISFGRDPKTKAAILSRGFMLGEKRLDGTLENIGELAEEAKTPAILVIGEVAGIMLTNSGSGEFSNLSFTVTGSLSFASRLKAALEELGGYVNLINTIRIVPDEDIIPEDIEGFDWLVFTSANGIRTYFDALRRRRTDLRTLGRVKFACIGEGSAGELEKYGFYSDFVPKRYTAKCLGEELPEVMQTGSRALIMRAANGSEELNEALDAAGVSYRDLKIYHTENTGSEGEECETDYIIFASAMGARAFFERRGIAAFSRVICIGEVTEREVRAHTKNEIITAKRHDIEGIIEAVREDVRFIRQERN